MILFLFMQLASIRPIGLLGNSSLSIGDQNRIDSSNFDTLLQILKSKNNFGEDCNINQSSSSILESPSSKSSDQTTSPKNYHQDKITNSTKSGFDKHAISYEAKDPNINSDKQVTENILPEKQLYKKYQFNASRKKKNEIENLTTTSNCKDTVEQKMSDKDESQKMNFLEVKTDTSTIPQYAKEMFINPLNTLQNQEVKQSDMIAKDHLSDLLSSVPR